MGEAHHGGFGNERMLIKGIFNFGGTHAVTRYVQYVVDPSRNTDVAFFIAQGTVTGKVVAVVGIEVGIEHALVITVHGTDLPGP